MKKNPIDAVHDGLRALEESMFPKKCSNCGRVYRTMEEFMKQTHALPESTGLFAVRKKHDTSMIGVFRNCPCNSTLLVPCKDRRGRTRQQLKRRRIFGGLLETLEKTGWKRDEARLELLKFIRGEASKLLSRYTSLGTGKP